MGCRSERGAARWAILAIVAVWIGGEEAKAQIPGLSAPAPAAPAKKAGADTTKIAPTAGNPKATVATSSGKIAVREGVTDAEIRRTLNDLLPQYPGVRKVEVKVSDGVVTLNGRVDDDDTQDDVTDFTRRVEGVRLVLNRLMTDDEVMSATELAHRELATIGNFFARKWLLILLALGVIMLSTILARIFSKYSETLLSPFVKNVLLRSVVGSILSGALVLGGFLGALGILELTRAVLSILGLAGVIGLAVGFAFKDITENFIASVLLGVRRPFRIGDFVKLAGQAGVVQSLNTRATILVSSEGNHVRIPNSVVYKEILVNTSAWPNARGSFDLVIPYEASAASALEAMTDALKSQDGILAEPPPRALVDALEPGGVRLRVDFWRPTQGVDGDRLLSDAKLKVKVALQHAGIIPSAAVAAVQAPAAQTPIVSATPPVPAASADQARANLHRDAQAASHAAPVTGTDGASALDHVLAQGECHVGDEGVNLLEEKHAEVNGAAA